jgi:dTMP kinase
MNPQGKFITFEGIDGAGKTTHIARCVELLQARGVEVLQTREPGGSPLAEQLRKILLQQSMSLTTELLLMFAARRDHLEHLIEPALARGAWVVCDRFTDSSYAYQGAGRGLGEEPVAKLEAMVHPTRQPDHTFYFDLAPEIAAERRAKARAADRFEAEDVQFFQRVRKAYLDLAERHSARILVIDATQSIENIAKSLETMIATF